MDGLEVIVLAGGLGTRLKSVVEGVPKPMAPVGGRPFLEHLFDHFVAQGVVRAVVASGYKHEAIEEHFGRKYRSLSIEYSVESQPLGTGGSIRLAMGLVRLPDAIIVNGDTLFKVDFPKLVAFHSSRGCDGTVALKVCESCGRYGAVELAEDRRVVGFREKETGKRGAINGGVYVLKKDLFERIEVGGKFSFEKDVLERHLRDLRFFGIAFDAYFIDIGVPEDYARAEEDLKRPGSA